jgi:hypothetical protein
VQASLYDDVRAACVAGEARRRPGRTERVRTFRVPIPGGSGPPRTALWTNRPETCSETSAVAGQRRRPGLRVRSEGGGERRPQLSQLVWLTLSRSPRATRSCDRPHLRSRRARRLRRSPHRHAPLERTLEAASPGLVRRAGRAAGSARRAAARRACGGRPGRRRAGIRLLGRHPARARARRPACRCRAPSCWAKGGAVGLGHGVGRTARRSASSSPKRNGD